jgi:hypothetical protein
VEDAVSNPSVNDYPSAVGAAAEHPADPKIVGPSTDPQVLEMGPIVAEPVPDPLRNGEFIYKDARGKEHDTAGEASKASQPKETRWEAREGKDDNEE